MEKFKIFGYNLGLLGFRAFRAFRAVRAVRAIGFLVYRLCKP